VTGPIPIDYSRRVGIAVRTDARVCMAIGDNTLTPGNPVTLVLTVSPQRFLSAQISKSGIENCPITREAGLGITSYDLSVTPAADIPKLTPLVAVVGSPESNGFAIDNLNVVADLDQTRSQNTFRSCGENEGIRLTMWRGAPITGTRLWAGSYYEDGQPGSLPTCTPGEMAPK